MNLCVVYNQKLITGLRHILHFLSHCSLSLGFRSQPISAVPSLETMFRWTLHGARLPSRRRFRAISIHSCIHGSVNMTLARNDTAIRRLSFALFALLSIRRLSMVTLTFFRLVSTELRSLVFCLLLTLAGVHSPPSPVNTITLPIWFPLKLKF